MSVDLRKSMTEPPAREKVVAECVTLVDEEVKGKGGLSGMAVKGAYGMVKTFKPKFVTEVVDSMLNEWVDKLAPFVSDWEKLGKNPALATYFGQRGEEIAEKLLEVTDGRAKGSKHTSVVKMYTKMRPSAKKHVQEALPRLGKLVEKYAAEPAAAAKA